MNAVVLDFETTGLSPADSEVVEFALVRVEEDGTLGLNLSSLCRPHGRISYGAYRVHGITEAMVRDKPYFEECLPMVLDFIGNAAIVCHNTPFDMGFLTAYCRRAGIEFCPQTEDTLKMARRLLPGLPNRTLSTVAAHFGIEAGGAHRALADAIVTAKVYTRLRALCAVG